MRFAALVAAFALLACQREAPPPPSAVPERAETPNATPRDAGPPGDAPPAPTYRTADEAPRNPAVEGSARTYIVASESVDASNVGKAILASGGNAADAAVATAFALAVTHPSAGNIGGGGFAVVRVARGKAVALDFRETAPASATPTMYLDEKGDSTRGSLEGWRASGTPGSVAGLHELHRKLGKKPWRDVVQPAIDLARKGFVIDKHTGSSLARVGSNISRNPVASAFWIPGGTPRKEGDTVAIPELAVALERIRDKGPAGFYKGPTAKAIADAMSANGGTITLADLAAYKAVWREPLRFSYRGHSVVSMPLPSSGGLILAMTAGILRERELKEKPWHGAEHIHVITEAWRRAFATRNGVLGDPDFVKDVPIAKLLSQEYLDSLARQIAASETTASKSSEVPPLIEGDHTTNLSVVDGDGMAVALTTTLNTSWGSGVMIHGFLMNNEMDDFATKPGSPNVFGLVQHASNKIEPGKRMLSSMTPTFVEDGAGDLVMVVGAQGGPRIVSAVWQVMSNVVDYGHTAAMAVALPRFHHQHLPDKIFVERASLTRETSDTLTTQGYTLDWPARGFGAANAIVRTPSGWDASADPREGGGVAGD